MFKKDVKISGQHRLSKKDKKKLSENLSKVQCFHNESLQFLLNLQLYIAKLSGASLSEKMRIIISDGNPIFIEVDRAKQVLYIPSCKEIFQCQHVHKGIQKYLYNGADLMWPGVLNFSQVTSPTVSGGDIVAISQRVVNQDDVIFAVGVLISPYYGIGGLKGKVVSVWNFLGDKLWQLGHKKVEGALFRKMEKQEFGQEEVKVGEEDIVCVSSEEIKAVQVQNQVGEDGDGDQKQNQSTDQLQEEQSHQHKAQQQQQEEKKSLPQQQTNQHDQQNSQQSKQQQIPPQQMDQIITTAALNSFKITLKDDKSMLPMQPSVFKSDHLFPCSYIPIDFSKSTFKKLGKFLSYLDKQGIIKYNDSKSNKSHPLITSIVRDSERVKNHQPSMKKPMKKIKQSTHTQQTHEQSQYFINYPRVVIEEYLKLNEKLSGIFNSLPIETRQCLGMLKSQFFSVQDCREFIVKYIEVEKLQDGVESKKEIRNDIRISKLLNNSTKETVTKAQVFNRYGSTLFNQFYSIKGNLNIYHIIFKGSGIQKIDKKFQKLRPGLPQSVKITLMNIANKKITKITGLDLFDVDLDLLSKYLQKKCSGSSSVQQNEITVQGATHGDFIQSVLVDCCKIPKKYISILNNLKSKKKKKK